MLIKLHGMFAKNFGPEIYIEAGTVAEAIEGFSRQVNFYNDRLLEDRPLTRVIGFDDEESFYKPTEQKEIHLVPAMIGGGGGFGRILIGAALIVIGVIISPIPGIGQTLGPALIASGIAMVIGGVMSFFVKAPTTSKDNDPEASKYLGLGENTVEIGTVIPWQCGRGPATGHILALNVDSSDMLMGSFPSTPS